MLSKLRNLLNAHGIIVYESDNVFHCYVYANSDEYDILSISKDEHLLCNGNPINILEWLGY